MNTQQKNYIAARALFETISSVAKSKHPAEPTDAISDDVWEAYFEACEEIDAAEGLTAARADLLQAENELIEWGSKTPAGRISKLDFAAAAKHLGLRAKLVDVLMRVAV